MLTPKELRAVADAIEARGVEANSVNFPFPDEGPRVLIQREDWDRLGWGAEGEHTCSEVPGVVFWRKVEGGIQWETNFHAEPAPAIQPGPCVADQREAV